MKILTVYNTAGISGRENVNSYIESLSLIYGQKNVEQKIVVSSCLNNETTIQTLKNNFNDLEIVRYDHRFTVNMTFNKTVKIMIEKYGKFDAYLYVDSGVLFTDNRALEKACESYKKNNYGMLAFQTNTDTGYQYFGENYKLDCETAQITGEDKIVPFALGINLHAQLFSHEIYQIFGNIIPDIFIAYCTESTFPFLCASINKKWAILKDIILIHKRSMDGASSGYSHISQKYFNPWNNLFADRDARVFISDKEAVDAGLGYEECNSIMVHNKESYHEDYVPKNKDLLINKIKQYFFLDKKELDYDKIPYSIR